MGCASGARTIDNSIAAKSGGGRTVYYVAVAPGVLFMMTAYPKNERDDLSPEAIS
jgi:hypothetical protein